MALAIPQPGGTRFTFAELVDVPALQQLATLLYDAAGIPVGILDARDGSVLIGAGWQEICTYFHRAHPVACQRCMESDSYIKDHLEAELPLAYKCRNGMWDIALPIVVDGEHLATLFVGQFLYEAEEVDRDFFRAQAMEFGFDVDRYLEALDRIPVFSRERVDSMLRYYGGLVKVLAETGLARKREMATQQALRASRAFYRAAIDNIGDAFLIVCPDGEILDVNRYACERLGYSHEELTSMNLAELDVCARAEGHCEWSWAQGQPGEVMTIESRYRRKDGSEFPVEVRWASLVGDDQTWMLGLARDITERKQAEAERSKLDAQVQEAQRLESLGVLAGGIAHDFNNLLMVILGNVDLALQDLSGVAPVRTSIEEIERAAHRAAELCKQMLTYSGHGHREIRPLKLSELVEEMTHMLEVSVSKKAVLRYDLCSDLPLIEADASQLRQVIMSLVTNASEAIGDHSGVISVRTGTMLCDGPYLADSWVGDRHPEGAYAFLEVSDTGCGMDEETRKKAFDPFFSTKFMGRGLGLAAVLGIVRSHSGAIKVYSERNIGTTFKVLFPAAVSQFEAKVEAVRPRSAWKGAGTILLVDDEEAIRILGKRMLERLGFEVITASDGREALDVFEKMHERIQCVVLDLTMPHMDGEEAFREMRRVKKDVTVVLASGYSEQDISERFVGKGLAGFVQKPYQSMCLAETLERVLKA